MRLTVLGVIALTMCTAALAAPEKMRGVQVGEGAKLSVQEMAVPRPGAGEVLIKVRSASVNPVDWKIAARRVGQVAGADVAGVIDTLGEGVTGWKVGEPVLGVAPARFSDVTAAAALPPVASIGSITSTTHEASPAGSFE